MQACIMSISITRPVFFPPIFLPQPQPQTETDGDGDGDGGGRKRGGVGAAALPPRPPTVFFPPYEFFEGLIQGFEPKGKKLPPSRVTFRKVTPKLTLKMVCKKPLAAVPRI